MQPGHEIDAYKDISVDGLNNFLSGTHNLLQGKKEAYIDCDVAKKMGIEYNELKEIIKDPVKIAEKIWSKKELLIKHCVKQVEMKLAEENYYYLKDKDKINNISLKLNQIKDLLPQLNKSSTKY